MPAHLAKISALPMGFRAKSVDHKYLYKAVEQRGGNFHSRLRECAENLSPIMGFRARSVEAVEGKVLHQHGCGF